VIKQQHWIFDGYNVMHALHQMHPEWPFETARDAFIRQIETFQSHGDKKLTLVFDGQGTRIEVHTHHPQLHIIYSPTGLNADGTILMLIRQTVPLLRPYVRVVTRDFLLRDAIVSYHCAVLTPNAFFQELKRYRTQPPQSAAIALPYRPFQEFFKRLNAP
jgi:predicted RNA-binding protein with PIN domain